MELSKFANSAESFVENNKLKDFLIRAAPQKRAFFFCYLIMCTVKIGFFGKILGAYLYDIIGDIVRELFFHLLALSHFEVDGSWHNFSKR